MMRSYREFPERSYENEVHISPEISNENRDLYSDFLPNSNRSTDQVNYEMTSYENMNVQFYDNFDILEWWNINKNQYPLLYKVSCNILATPASSASSERTFSAARGLLNEKRCNTSANNETVNKMMFLQANIPNSLFGTE